jgi:hypothetical protein
MPFQPDPPSASFVAAAPAIGPSAVYRRSRWNFSAREATMPIETLITGRRLGNPGDVGLKE